MYNAKAFLEGLIVNEVLTKTASFEKLAQPPGMFPQTPGMYPQTPGMYPQTSGRFPPTVADLVQATQAGYAAQAALRAERRENARKLQELRDQVKDVLPKLSNKGRNAVYNQIRMGQLPDKDKLLEEYPKQRPKNPTDVVPTLGAPPLVEEIPPGMNPSMSELLAAHPQPPRPQKPLRPQIPPRGGIDIPD
jgi:hypothetical protein